MRTRKHAVIVGAGIGGPATALWLQRIGLEVTLTEARTSSSLVEGAFLGVAPNGMNALAALGLAERVRRRGHSCQAFHFQNGAGAGIGGFDRSGDREAFGWPLTMIRRADLHALLAEACIERGLTPRYGLALTGVEEVPGGIRARFADGSELAADLLVGCDGLHSVTRSRILPEAPAPRSTGLIDLGGFARADGLPFEPGVNEMVFGRHAFFGAFTTPDGETWWFHNGAQAEARLDAEGYRARMLELHRDDPAWIRRLIQGTQTILGPWPIHELHAMPRWSKGRICLLGDAAHAMSPSAGQGASMALEDAVVLAQCLRDIDDVPSAFRTFERLRRPRVDAIFKEAQRNSNSKAPSAVGAWFRDRLMPLFLRFGARAQARSYAWKPDFDRRSRAL